MPNFLHSAELYWFGDAEEVVANRSFYDHVALSVEDLRRLFVLEMRLVDGARRELTRTSERLQEEGRVEAEEDDGLLAKSWDSLSAKVSEV